MVQAKYFTIQFLLATMMRRVMDSIYISLCNITSINAGYFIRPLCPLYGFGALLLLFICIDVREPFLARYGLYFVGMASVEFFDWT